VKLNVFKTYCVCIIVRIALGEYKITLLCPSGVRPCLWTRLWRHYMIDFHQIWNSFRLTSRKKAFWQPLNGRGQGSRDHTFVILHPLIFSSPLIVLNLQIYNHWNFSASVDSRVVEFDIVLTRYRYKCYKSHHIAAFWHALSYWLYVYVYTINPSHGNGFLRRLPATGGG